MKKRILMLIVLFGIGFVLSGCLASQDKVFTIDDLQITLTDDFKETDQDEGFTAYFESNTIGVAIMKETFASLEVIDLNSESTIEEYIAAVQSAGNVSYEIQNKDNITYFTYESEIDGTNFYYMTAFYKGNDAFWIVNLFCEETNKSELENSLMNFAKSVKFIKE